MQPSELGKTAMGVVLVFQFLQFFEERRVEGDVLATRLYQEFFKQEYPGIEPERGIKQPILYWEITLGILPILFSYAKTGIEQLGGLGFSCKDSYGITYTQQGEPIDHPDIRQIIHTMRNALAHLSDFAGGECILR